LERPGSLEVHHAILSRNTISWDGRKNDNLPALQVTGADHGYIQQIMNGQQGGVERPAIIAWLRYWIYNDQGAKHYFYGSDCVMCAKPWENPQRKNWPQ